MSVKADTVNEFFDAIKKGQTEKVRMLLVKNHSLSGEKMQDPKHKTYYDPEIEVSAYRFLGAYIGSCTGLQLSLLLGYDYIALDIIDVTFDEVLENLRFGDENTTLHLAAFLNAETVVEALLKRNIKDNFKNGKGFKAVDVTTSDKILSLFNKYKSN